MPFVRRTAIAAAVLVTAIFMTARLLDLYPWNERIFDLWAYWSTGAGLDFDAARPGVSGAYLYSPAFAHLIAPLTALPLPMFAAVWTGLLVFALGWLTGWRAFFIGVLAPVTMSIAIGQTDLLMAAAIVLGFRWPATWAVVLLTKITPGIGLLWFVVRREWRNLAIALGGTALIVAVSFALMPDAWFAWGEVLSRVAGRDGTWAAVPIPFIIRLPIAIAVVVWGAWTGRRWTVPVASMLALPALWYGGLSMLLAVIALREDVAPVRPPGSRLARPAAEPVG
jgi:hypothetical protein